MICHGPSCLIGPITHTRGWWEGDTLEAALPSRRGRSKTAMKKTRDPRPAEDAPIRQELVERVRREIAEGVYETPEKWEAALERLFDRLECDEC